MKIGALLFLIVVLLIRYEFVEGYVQVVPSLRYKPSIYGTIRVKSKTIVPSTTALEAVRRIGHRNSLLSLPNRRLSSLLSFSNALIALNVLSYLLTWNDQRIKYNYMKINNRVARGELYRLLTSLFIHANTHHLLTNAYTLSSLGPIVSPYLALCVGCRFITCILGIGRKVSKSTFHVAGLPCIRRSGQLHHLSFGFVAVCHGRLWCHLRAHGRTRSIHVSK